MTKENGAAFTGRTHIAAILDRSGSMVSLVSEVIGGYNAWLKTVRDAGGDVRITTTLFDTEYDVLCTDVAAKDAPKLANPPYFARGTTALNDAVGKCITELKSKVKKGDRALVLVATDGAENSSKEWSSKKVKDLIAKLEKKGNWTFTFLSASPSAWADAASYGTQSGNTQVFAATAAGTRSAFKGMKTSTETYLSSVAPSAWSFYQPKPDDEDDD